VAHGEQVFNKIGCAACHIPNLGSVKGVFSDLLLHDMGGSLVDLSAGYYSQPNRNPSEPPNIAARDPLPEAATARSAPPRTRTVAVNAGDAPSIGAGRTEWRTPPLWGVADSAPYMHDGRAATLGDAIIAHDGEAKRTVERWGKLASDEKQSVFAFLSSLRAP
jgi:CxxC motif-containing protein (DUF1111 family)